MTLDDLRALCLSFPHATEKIQWGDVLLFSVGGRMFVVVNLGAVPPSLSLKVSEEEFFTLQEIEGIVPAPYLARAKWVQLRTLATVPRGELERLVRASYEMVVARLPRKMRVALAQTPAKRPRRQSR